MKSWFTYIFIALYMFGMVSCTEDDLVKENYFDKVIVSLKLNVPGAESRVGGSYQPGSSTQNPYDDDLDEQTDYQRYIDDVHILLFEHKTDGSGKLLDATTTTLADKKQGQVTRTINGQFTKHTTSVDIVVLANLNQNGFKIEWDGLKGKTESAIYSGLVFSYPKEKWVLGKQARFLPMYGKKTNVTLNQSEISIDNFHLYRGVAKMGVQVASTCDNFIMKEIYVYHINQAGNFVSSKPLVEKTVTGGKTNQYLLPDVPSDSELRNVPIIYELSSEQEKSFLEQIYLLESDNKSANSEAEKLKVVVGGIYDGTGLVENNQISYYRIDMKDDKENPGGTKTDFDIVRNHSYIFNITKVLNPGTPTPDEALDEAVVGLKVEVEDWVDEPMRGVPDQYRLTTNKSVIQYASSTDREPQDLEIFTDYSDGWHIEWPGDTPVDWLTISKTTGEDNVTTEISLTPNNINQGVTRFARFYVVAGNIMKEITVIQPQPPTANCYVRDDSRIHELIVSIKGNGNDGIMPENQDIVPGEGDASIEPDKIGIIWETHGGLVKLLDPNDTPVTNTPGSVSYVDYDRTTNTIKYKVDMTGASIGGKSGGNALIGAFKNTAKEGQNPRYEVIWSWHIWVCPELIDSQTQIIKDECVENWTLNSYYVLDRNLGALADRPVETQEGNTKSVASMGLLYQWGRKDPFIGAAYSNDNFPTNSTGMLDVVHYYEDWAVTRYNKSVTDNLKTTVIEETIAHPTKLIYDYTSSSYWGNTYNTYYGMSSLADNGGYLWGTNNGLSTTVKDLGSKTIYDPCPVGYRVPPVDAFVFTAKAPVYEKGDFVESFTVNKNSSVTKNYGYPVYYSRNGNDTLEEDGNFTVSANNNARTYYVYKAIATTENRVLVSSETDNWRINLIYVPHHVDNMTDSRYQWGDDIAPSTNNSSLFIYNGDYVENAEYYGFYLNYTEMEEPKLTNDIYTYGDDDGDYYYYKPQADQTITWLPLTGAYDPSQGFTLNGTKIEEYSSVSVNSFLWTNSSVNNEDDGWIPGAMFLHGTEDGGNRGSGRHIHDLTASNIKAEPHYAGAVRCVKDVPKDKWDINSLTDQIPINSQVGSTTEITIKSVNADWELVDPGAPWLQVTPDKGSADKGKGTTITLKMLTAQPAGTTTTLVFQIANETEPRQCVVTVQ